MADDDVVVGGACYHPSIIIEQMGFGREPVRLSDDVKRPIYLLSAGNDPAFVLEGGDVINNLKGKDFGDKCGAKNYMDMQHGWVNRGDVTQENIRLAVEDAIKVTLEFFDRL